MKPKKLGGPNVKITTVSSNYDLNTQVGQIENFIANKTDIILVNAVDPKAIAPVLKKATDAGIVVVAFDVAAQGADATVMSDNTAAGTTSCDYLAKHIGGKGNVVIINGPPVSSVIDRVKGCEKVLSADGIKVLSDNQNAKGSRDGGLSVMARSAHGKSEDRRRLRDQRPDRDRRRSRDQTSASRRHQAHYLGRRLAGRRSGPERQSEPVRCNGRAKSVQDGIAGYRRRLWDSAGQAADSRRFCSCRFRSSPKTTSPAIRDGSRSRLRQAARAGRPRAGPPYASNATMRPRSTVQRSKRNGTATMDEGKLIFEMRGIYKSFGATHALRDVKLPIRSSRSACDHGRKRCRQEHPHEDSLGRLHARRGRDSARRQAGQNRQSGRGARSRHQPDLPRAQRRAAHDGRAERLHGQRAARSASARSTNAR